MWMQPAGIVSKVFDAMVGYTHLRGRVPDFCLRVFCPHGVLTLGGLCLVFDLPASGYRPHHPEEAVDVSQPKGEIIVSG